MSNININIDTNSLGQAADQVVEKFSHLTGSGILLVILAIVLPPVAVFFKLGITPHFWINIVLTVLGYFPGAFHALWVVLFF
jgi:uncharacterized membrane protein YqaE (UPF0057 family)